MVDRMRWFAESDVCGVCDRSCWTGGGIDLGISGGGRLAGDEAMAVDRHGRGSPPPPRSWRRSWSWS